MSAMESGCTRGPTVWAGGAGALRRDQLDLGLMSWGVHGAPKVEDGAGLG